jgi:hypothetical protein
MHVHYLWLACCIPPFLVGKLTRFLWLAVVDLH